MLSFYPSTFYFNQLYHWIANGPAPEKDEPFLFDELPFSSIQSIIFIFFGYLIVIFGGQWLLRTFKFKPFPLKFPFFIHNLLLSMFSGALLLAFVEQLYPMYQQHGLFHIICSARALTSSLFVIYYINYLTKLLELIDTVFLMLKQKEIGTVLL
ncbi:hypothetical protein HMI54_008837 [Coelomomyces lativittatus]|nr:hypothetical protein HMI54_008837 [Coelomomyces lativittatus]